MHADKCRQVGLLSLCLLWLACFTIACAPFSDRQMAGSASIQRSVQARFTYVALGASDAFGVGTENPALDSWPSVLADRLKAKQPALHLVNLGIPSITLHEALTRELPVAIDTQPNLVTIWLAVNDITDNVSASSYQQDLETLVSRLQAALPHARIAIGNVLDLTLLPHFQRGDTQLLQQQTAAYNSAIAAIVERHHVLLVDLYQQWRQLAANPEYISGDGLHPNTEGSRALAEIFYQALQRSV